MKLYPFFLFVLISNIAMAQETSHIKSLSVFKNGQSFVIKEIKAKVPDSGYRLTKLPQALFGTYWFAGTSNPVTLVSSSMEELTETKERQANSFPELLHANKGRTITLVTIYNDTYKGMVEDFELPEEINSKLQLQQLQLTASYQGQYSFDRIFTPDAPALLLKMEGKWVSIPPSTIRSISFEDKPNRTVAARIAVQKPVVTVHFDKSGTQTFDMMYLQNGFSWTPVYQLLLASETEATLHLQAEVSNNVEDITNTDIEVVAGVPNFSEATKLATLLHFGAATHFSEVDDRYRNVSQIVESRYARNTKDMMMETSAPLNLSAAENEDLYFYTLKNISLKKGARAHFPIFSRTVRIRHFYKAVLAPSTLNTYRAGVAEEHVSDDGEGTTGEGTMKPNRVDHFVQVYNNTESPFSSGSMMVLQKDTRKPAGQDVLKFTPKGASTPVFITSSPDILVMENEKITSVKKEAQPRSNGYRYALATVKGTVTIHNSKSKPVNIQVQKSIWGTPVSASIAYEQFLNTENKHEINPNRTLHFEQEVAPGQKKSFQYTYQIYVQE